MGTYTLCKLYKNAAGWFWQHTNYFEIRTRFALAGFSTIFSQEQDLNSAF